MNIFKKTVVFFLITLVVLSTGIFLFMQQKTFGKNPSGNRLERIKNSVNYKDGTFQNLTATEVMLKDASFTKMMWKFFNKPKHTVPPKILPSIKTDLKLLQKDSLAIVWFGHSSYLIKSRNKNILVDPVFSGNASPVNFFGKSFPGSDVYNVDDLPPIDLVIITHDHYDHLDYKTIKQLIGKAKKFYAPLGVGAHLEHWGIEVENIVEFDWWDKEKIEEDIEITATPARHFSGRGFMRGKTLWTSYVLKIHEKTIFIGGDSGYDDTFKTIGEKFGPFDIVMLEAGQYGKDWPYIHMTPEETVKAAEDLNAKVLLPVHWGKFALAYHEWKEPIDRVVKKARESNLKVTTPLIGEPVVIGSEYPNAIWWNF